MLALEGETIVIRRGTAAASGRRNDGGTDWTDPVDTEVAGCLIAPRSTSENLDGRTGVIVGVTVYLPAWADITSADRLVIRGELYDVNGEPGVWTSPGHPECDGIEVAAKRSEG